MDGRGRWLDNVFTERFWRTIKYKNINKYSYDIFNIFTTEIIFILSIENKVYYIIY